MLTSITFVIESRGSLPIGVAVLLISVAVLALLEPGVWRGLIVLLELVYYLLELESPL